MPCLTVRLAADNSWQAVCWSPELQLYACVTGSGRRVMTSPNGVNWSNRSSAADNAWSSPADLGWRSLCWSPQRRQFAAVSNSGAGNRVMVSP